MSNTLIFWATDDIKNIPSDDAQTKKRHCRFFQLRLRVFLLHHCFIEMVHQHVEIDAVCKRALRNGFVFRRQASNAPHAAALKNFDRFGIQLDDAYDVHIIGNHIQPPVIGMIIT